MNDMSSTPAAAVKAEEHWTTKDGDVKLFLFEKYAGDPKATSAAPSCSSTARRWRDSRPSTFKSKVVPIPR